MEELRMPLRKPAGLPAENDTKPASARGRTRWTGTALMTLALLLLVVTGTGASGVFAFAMCTDCKWEDAREHYVAPSPETPKAEEPVAPVKKPPADNAK
jgi:hypothetical protein